MAIKAYQVADLLRVAAGRPVAHRHTTALIAAAGSSTRMGGETSKQLLDIDGTPVLARTLMAHQLAESVDEIVLIARREDFEAFISPLWLCYNLSLSRVPMNDFYDTVTSLAIGCRHRSVVGGIFIKLLEKKFEELKNKK